LYGHPAASAAAQTKLKKTLTANGHFRTTDADDCVYVNQSTDEDHYGVLGAWVDDLLGATTPKGIDQMIDSLSKVFKIKVTKNPTMVLGVQIERSREHSWLKIHQAAYVEGILRKHGMEDCRTVSTPMDPATVRALMELPTEPVDLEARRKFQALVGELIWLHKTRPDMHFTVNLLSRFLKCATAAHLKIALGRPLRYLKGTMDFGIVFFPGNNFDHTCASDADLAGDLKTSQSTSGEFARLGNFGVNEPI